MNDPIELIVYGVGVIVIGLFAATIARRWRRARRHEGVLRKSLAQGAQPASLYPRIDEHACICSGACVAACPEPDVIGLIDGRPRLVSPSSCIGHGECQRACPVSAIRLVMGSAERGVELPILDGDHQTRVPGIYIAGELGGMGLIHNAMTQGVQAMSAIAASLGDKRGCTQVIIVGAGPAGLAAALEAKRRGLDYVVLDQGPSIGGTLRSFPRQKIVMTAPSTLPLVGAFEVRRTSKEALIDAWDTIAKTHALAIEHGVRVTDLAMNGDGLLEVNTDRGWRRAERVLLAIGRRGTPRKLGVDGEALEKVAYELVDPEQYRGLRVAVVGGGDSALEAAAMLAPLAVVTLVHRGRGFPRVKPDNLVAVQTLRDEGRLTIVDGSTVRSIDATQLHVAPVEDPTRSRAIDNDFVLVCAGGELPSAWLREAGVELWTARGDVLPRR